MESGTVKPADLLQSNHWQKLLLPLSLLLLTSLALWMIVSQFGSSLVGSRAESVLELDQTKFIDETGVQLTLAAITAGGGMIELRYRVVDPDKAVVIHDDENPPTIVDERSGEVLFLTMHVLDRSKIRAHDDDVHLGITYNTRIMNAGGLIERGDRITVRVGDTELKHVPVQ